MSLPPFQHLVDEHWRDVARLAHGLAPGHGDDVAQQAWTQALAAYPRLTDLLRAEASTPEAGARLGMIDTSACSQISRSWRPTAPRW